MNTQTSGENTAPSSTQSTSRSSSFIPRPDPVMEWATTGTSSDPPGQSATFNQYPSGSNQSGTRTTYHTQVNIRPPILRRAPVSTPNVTRNFTGHNLLPPTQQPTTSNARSEPPGNVYSPIPHFYGQYHGYEYPSGGQGTFYGGGAGTMGPMDAGPGGLGSVHGNQNPSSGAAVFGMSGPTNMHPTGPMALSSESGMDAGWLSFMRDCGIMDTTEGGGL
jgi:hypothetical protein